IAQGHELQMVESSALGVSAAHEGEKQHSSQVFDIYHNLQRAEWDTLMFFYGVIMCVGGLGAFGYLVVGSELMYEGLGPTQANIIVGFASAIVDNIPVMFAVLQMSPDMSQGQWLLVTLTAGVGGSMLSIGSAAGVAVMGTARGVYTFFSHLKWSWAILLGYIASIATHFAVNASLFT
ncbi:MAG: sodium:proton antiporter NhaD, partial [Lysobacterales bacterium]